MIKRLVKMEFAPDQSSNFIALFDSVKEKILNSQGCHSLELIRDINNTNIFFTVSVWESEEMLNLYRNSELFAKTWRTTKAMFSEKATAWSTNSLYSL